jgi:hypothetical protein
MSTPRNKEAQIIYQSALKNAVEYLKLRDKKNITVNELFNLTYMMANFCEFDTKGDEHFKVMVQKMDDILEGKE